MLPADSSAAPRRVTVRAATAADATAVSQIYAHYVLGGTATFEVDPPSAAEIERRMEEVQSRGLPYLVAEDESEVIGYAYATPYRPRAAYRFTVEDSIYLRDGMKGRGVGTTLLAALIQECQVAGARQMIAVIADSGSDASVRLHARFGFQHAGTLRSVGFKLGRWVDTTLMQLSL